MQIPIVINASGPLPEGKDIYFLAPEEKIMEVVLPNITSDGIYIRLNRIDDDEGKQVNVIAYDKSQSINGQTNLNIPVDTGFEIISINNMWRAI